MQDMQCFRVDTDTYETLELPLHYVPGDTIIYGHYHDTSSPYIATYVVVYRWLPAWIESGRETSK